MNKLKQICKTLINSEHDEIVLPEIPDKGKDKKIESSPTPEEESGLNIKEASIVITQSQKLTIDDDLNNSDYDEQEDKPSEDQKNRETDIDNNERDNG